MSRFSLASKSLVVISLCTIINVAAGYSQTLPPLNELVADTSILPKGDENLEWDIANGKLFEAAFLGEDGSFVIVYKRSSNEQFYYTIVNRYGEMQDFEIDDEELYGESSRTRTEISVCALEKGDFIVALSDVLPGVCEYGIFAKRYDADGIAIGDFQRIDQGIKPNYETERLKIEVVDYSEGTTPNDAIISWIDMRRQQECGIEDHDSVDGKIVSFDQDGWGMPFNERFLCGEAEDCNPDEEYGHIDDSDYGDGALEFNPDICLRADKTQFVVTWKLLETNLHINYSVFNMDGTPIQNNEGFIRSEPGLIRTAASVSDYFVIAWQEQGDVFGRFFNFDNPGALTDATQLSIETVNAVGIDVANLEEINEFIAVWETDSHNINGRIFYPNTSLPPQVVLLPDDSELELAINAGNRLWSPKVATYRDRFVLVWIETDSVEGTRLRMKVFSFDNISPTITTQYVDQQAVL